MLSRRNLQVLAALLIWVAAAAASASAGAKSSSDPDKPAQWEDISGYASNLQERLTNNPRFGGLEYVDAASPTLVISWVGQADQQLLAEVAKHPGGVTVTVRGARYSHLTLEDAAKSLIAASPGSGWVSAWPREDGQGVYLEVDGDLEKAESEAEAAVPVDVTVIPSQGIPVAAASRQLDDSPFNAGAQIRNRANQEFCTAGFRFRTPSGGYRMLTAWHCNGRSSTSSYYNTHSADSGGPGITLGQQVGGGYGRSDSSFLVAPSGSSYGTGMYDGPYNGTSKSTVTGAEAPVVGGYVCLSGGYSGVVCNNRVLSTGVTTQVANLDGSLFTIDNGFVTSQTGGVGAAGHGDSGGPVYVSASSGVHAVGMIDAIYAAYSQPCRGAYWISLQCSSRVLDIGIKAIQDASGYSVG
jgi:hypothetical protein